MRQLQTTFRNLTILLIVLTAIAALVCPSVNAVSSDDLIRHTLCDVRVLYVFDDPETIDWPVLYYLNQEFGCRIDLLTLGERSQVRYSVSTIEDREIYLHRLFLAALETEVDSVKTDSSSAARPDTLDKPPAKVSVINGVDFGPLSKRLFHDRLPDIAIFAAGDGTSIYNDAKTYMMYRLPDGGYFSIRKFIEPTNARSPVEDETILTLNRRELFNRYRDQMDYEIPQLFGSYRAADYEPQHLGQYRVLRSTVETHKSEVGFLAGIHTLRLLDLINTMVKSGPMQKTFERLANTFVSSFRASIGKDYRARAEGTLHGYRELLNLNENAQARTESEFAPLKTYLNGLVEKAQRATLQAVGVGVEGDVILRDSPHGPRIKYRLEASADGPTPIDLIDVKFHPFWDTSAIILQGEPRVIQPHQSYVREFLIDIGRDHWEAQQAESLLFTATVAYGTIPLQISNSLPLRQAPDLHIQFEPNFFFVPPVARIDVDRVVASMNWKAIITKPRSYAGEVEFEFVPSRGIYAGAYRRSITLRPGATRETVRIPFSVSNLFEEGIQEETITLTVADQIVAADTGMIRTASCRIADTVKIGFLPDTDGALEDVLRLTGAGFQPLTDRTLVTGDLDAYNVLVIGSGALERYPSISLVKDRLLEFVREGGSIVVFGQREDEWGDNILPISIIPFEEFISSQRVTATIPEANILSRPYNVPSGNIVAAMKGGRTAFPAVVSPGEIVFASGRGSALLSVSRIGQGQVVYCGLPVLQLVAELNLDAIHLFANILNY